MRDERPNILIITTHDTGRHFGCYGAAGVDSPHIDRIAAEGVRFDQCFTACPVCSASRAAMMTGRYPQSNGLMGLVHQPWWWEMHPDEQHLSQVLRDAGYATRLFGVQHETADVSRLGFGEATQLKGEPAERNALRIAEKAAESMGGWGAADKPTYAQVGFFETHTPYAFGGSQPGDPDAVEVPPYIQDDAAAREHLAALAGSVMQADDAVGTILDGLEQNGLAQNTLVVLTVDHGVELSRRAKWTCYDPGLSIALLMRWPAGGVRGGRVVGGQVSNVDVLPTLLELIGEPVPERLQGQSLKPLLDGAVDAGRDEVYAMFTSGCEPRCVRTERYKLIRNFQASRPLQLPAPIRGGASVWGPRAYVELYDLQNDPWEMTNAADEPSLADVRKELDAKLLAWMRDVGDPLLDGPVATPYYQRAVADLLTSESA